MSITVTESGREGMLRRLRAAGLRPTPHPMLPWPSDEKLVDLMLAQPDAESAVRVVADLFQERERLIRMSRDAERGDPANYGYDLPHWHRVRDGFAEHDVVANLGGIRSSKTENGAKELARSIAAFGEGLLWCLTENIETSRAVMQSRIWKYLPRPVKALNSNTGKRQPGYKIDYDSRRGFSSGGGNAVGELVLPNKTRVAFLTFNQDPAEFQGVELGFPFSEVQRVLGSWDEAEGPRPVPLGWWADEDLPEVWYDTLRDRSLSRNAKGLWTYAPKYGITPLMRRMIAGAETVLSERAELLSEGVVHVKGCPRGEMPLVQRCAIKKEKAQIIYFWNQHNIMPDGNYPGLRERLAGEPAKKIKELAYGYADEIAGRAFTKFGAWNIVPPARLPEAGTNYMIADPAGARAYFVLWVRVPDTHPRELWVYREWPGVKRYGEWALPDANVRGGRKERVDGVPGPAQQPMGKGYAEYKNEWLREETVWSEVSGLTSTATDGEEDPYRRRIAGLIGQGSALFEEVREVGEVSGLTSTATGRVGIRERIQERFMDPRAFKAPQLDGVQTTCTGDKFAEVTVNAEGVEIAPSMVFIPAETGGEIQTGVAAINDLLNWNTEEPYDELHNRPRLFVCEECESLIWALTHWTGIDGEKGASKDPVDCLRYAANMDLPFVGDSGVAEVSGGGSW